MNRILTALILGTCLATAGCGSSGGNQNQGNSQTEVTPDPALDTTATILKGPYLHAPAEGTITVSWETEVASSSRVAYGLAGEPLVEASGRVFLQQPTTTDPLLQGNIPAGYQHEVVLTGLVPRQLYAYEVRSASGLASGEFLAPPELDGDGFSVLAFGDTRTGHDDHRMVMSAIQERIATSGLPAFMINTGDMTMTGGSSQWETFFEIEAPLLASVPILPVFGNHDFLLGRTQFEALFRAPPTSTSGNDRYYSARLGSAHVVVVDISTMDFEPHLDWIEEELLASTSPFKVVVIHAPLITLSKHLPDFDVREVLVPLFEDTGVQLVLAGHNHCYERFLGRGSHYVTTAGGGAPLYDTDENPDLDLMGTQRMTAVSTFHYTWITVEGGFMAVETVDAGTGARIDCFRIQAGAPATTDLPCD